MKTRYKIGKKKPLDARLAVVNRGMLDEPRPATLTVTLASGAVVYSEQIMVFDAPGDGATWFRFAGFKPKDAEPHTLTVTIDDDDPDVDMATRVTYVKSPSP